MKTVDNTPPDIRGVEKTGLDGITSGTAAWKVDMDATREHRGLTTDQEATVCAWIVRAPWANCMWKDYILYCIHLRDIPGQSQSPVIQRPGATHEIGLYALSPDHTPCLDGSMPTHFLTPVNFVGQFIADSDQHAADLIEYTVHEICNGTLSPDTDYRKLWKARFGSYCFKEPESELDRLVADGGGAIMQDGKVIVQWEGAEPPPKPTTH